MLHSAHPMSPRAPSAVAIALAWAVSGAPSFAQTPALRVEQSVVPGSPVRRASVEVDYPVAFQRVAARLLDFSGYPGFLRSFQSARVVRRSREGTDVYFVVDLPRALGNFWFLHRMSVQRRADRLVIEGVSREGNAGYVETHVDLQRTGASSCRLRFSLYAVPTVPAHPESVSSILRRAVEGGAEGLLRASQSP